MQNKGMLKRAISTVLVLAMLHASVGILSSCGQNKVPEEPGYVDTTPVDPPNVDPEVEKIAVSSLISENIGTTDYRTEFNRAVIKVCENTLDVLSINEININEFTIAEQGKIEFEVTYSKNLKTQTEVITYEGDTTKFDTFYGLGQKKEEYIASLVAEAGATVDGEVEKHGQTHVAIVTSLQTAKSNFASQKAEFEKYDFREVHEEQKPNENEKDDPEIEYITVQEIVDEVFAGIDVDADLREVAEDIVATVSTTNTMDKVIAFDYEVAEDGKIVFYTQNHLNHYKFIVSYELKVDTTKLTTYLDATKNLDSVIDERILQKGYTKYSTLEKDSDSEKLLKEELLNLIQDYITQKEIVRSIDLPSMEVDTILNTNPFDEGKMQTLGITEMNAFANALLTNDRGKNYDLVTGWTMDDVATTYVGEFSGEAIDYSSRVNFLIITKEGMYNYRLWTQRYYGSTENRYGMILNNNPNTGVTTVEETIGFTDNVILFDENGERLTFEATAPEFYKTR